MTAPSPHAFCEVLYREHLEEAGFLYEQRLALLADPATSWLKLESFERRLEAHVDALVVGADLALRVCRQRLMEGDAGELFASVCVLCRQRDARLLTELWRELDFSDQDRVKAVASALKWELPASWESACEQAIARRDPRLAPILVDVCGYRRLPLGDQVGAALLSEPRLIGPGTVWALSRFPVSAAVQQALEHCFQNESPSVRTLAAIGLLRASRRGILPSCRAAAENEDWSLLPLGLAGDVSAVALLRQKLAPDKATVGAVRAAGLLGDLSVVRPLVECLENEALADTAGWALFWITGAGLMGERFEPEPVVEDELFPKELKAWRQRGEAPKRADGSPFGTKVRELSRDVEEWDRWLQQNASQFPSRVRYRRGQAYSPMVVLDCITDPGSPHALRRFAYEELVIHYGCSISFEADWKVADQRAALNRMHQWAQEAQTRFQAGGL